ncbi:hypothetical protein CPER28S_02459 [Cellulomonas persica]
MGESGAKRPAPKKMSEPVVNASAEIDADSAAASGPSCTRTCPSPVPNAVSMRRRTPPGSGAPPPRRDSMREVVDASRSPPS